MAALSNAAKIAKLQTRENTILTEIATLTSSTNIGKPNSHGIGAGLDHVGKLRQLYEELSMIQKLITMYEGPIEIRHTGM
jgi:hypothetical protein